MENRHDGEYIAKQIVNGAFHIHTTHLRLADKRLGLPINFNAALH